MSPSRVLAAAAFALGVLATGLRAEEPPSSRVLLPVYTASPIPGVNGSSWTTDFWISNSGPGTVEVEGIGWECSLPSCGNLPAPIGPGVSFRPIVLGEEGGLQGVVLYPNAAGAEHLGFGLRFRDLSRQSTTGGTELPTPGESDFWSTAFSLVDVPVRDGFRQTLRVYELDGTEREASVRVRVFRLDPSHTQPDDEPDVLLGEAVVPLAFAPPFAVPPYHPGYAEVTDLSTLAPLGDAESLRIQIEAVTPGLKLWAFVTVIHNETQHATVISP
jgi:hypothetical protein